MRAQGAEGEEGPTLFVEGKSHHGAAGVTEARQRKTGGAGGGGRVRKLGDRKIKAKEADSTLKTTHQQKRRARKTAYRCRGLLT